MWLEWPGEDGVGRDGGRQGCRTPLLGNSLLPLAGQAALGWTEPCSHRWPAGSERFPGNEKGGHRAFALGQGRFGAGGAWHPGVREERPLASGLRASSYPPQWPWADLFAGSRLHPFPCPRAWLILVAPQ